MVLRSLLVFLFMMMSVILTGADYHEIVVFVGHPDVSLMVAGELKESLKGKIPLRKLTPEEKEEYACVIIKQSDKYFWKSREGYEVTRHLGRGGIMFRRLDRPDYVWIIHKSLRDPSIRWLLGETDKHHYVEHITDGLISINYWGRVVSEEDGR